jgi:hypothetical protein
MRLIALAAALALGASACAAPGQMQLIPADAATALISGARVTIVRAAAVGGAPRGQDPLIVLTLSRADGRIMRFEEANHAPFDLQAQTPGGPLSQAMGLFGDERPTLYHARAENGFGAPFLCGPNGPLSIGVYEAPDAIVHVVGLRRSFEFESRPDGDQEALPYSPDQVCARLHFRRG